MRKLIILVSILWMLFPVMLFSGGSNETETEAEYVFATDATWPPMEYINNKKELIGFDIDLVRAIAKVEGFKVKFVSTGWDGIFAGLLNGEYDAIISSVTITEERKKSMIFSNPYFNAGQILAMRAEDVDSVSGLADLSGKKVGVQIGTSAAFYVEEKFPDVILKTYDELGPAVIELATGTIDGIVADVPLIVEYLLNNKKYINKFKTVGSPMTNEEYGIAVARENSTKLLEKINNGLSKIKENGEYDQIYSKWIK